MSEKFNIQDDKSEGRMNSDVTMGRSFNSKTSQMGTSIGMGDPSESNPYNYYNNFGNKDATSFNNIKGNDSRTKDDEEQQTNIENLLGNFSNLTVGNGNGRNLGMNGNTSDMQQFNPNYFNANDTMNSQTGGTPGSTPNSQPNTIPKMVQQRGGNNDSIQNLDYYSNNGINSNSGLNWPEDGENKQMGNNVMIAGNDSARTGLTSQSIQPQSLQSPLQFQNFFQSQPQSQNYTLPITQNLDLQQALYSFQNPNFGTLFTGQGQEVNGMANFGINNINGMNNLNNLNGMNNFNNLNALGLNNILGLVNTNLQGLPMGLGLNQYGLNQLNLNQTPQIQLNNQMNNIQSNTNGGKNKQKKGKNYNNNQMNNQNKVMNNLIQGQNKSLFLNNVGMYSNAGMGGEPEGRRNKISNMRNGNNQTMQNKNKGKNSKKEIMEYSEAEIVEKASQLARDHNGSLGVQNKYEDGNLELKEKIFNNLRQDLLSLSKDIFGNYAVQKLLPDIKPEESEEIKKFNKEKAEIIYITLRSKLLDLATNMYGCRVVQQLIKVIDSSFIPEIEAELEGELLKVIQDQNGNHVVQALVDRAGPEEMKRIFDLVLDSSNTLATHQYGCRVLQRVFERGDEIMQKKIIEKLNKSIPELIKDQYGNYLIQLFLKSNNSFLQNSVYNVLKGHIYELSKQKFASNVIEVAIKQTKDGNKEYFNQIFEEVISKKEDKTVDTVNELLKDKYGNYIIQRLFEFGSPAQRDELLNIVFSSNTVKKKEGFSKHVLQYIEKMGFANNNNNTTTTFNNNNFNNNNNMNVNYNTGNNSINTIGNNMNTKEYGDNNRN